VILDPSTYKFIELVRTGSQYAHGSTEVACVPPEQNEKISHKSLPIT